MVGLMGVSEGSMGSNSSNSSNGLNRSNGLIGSIGSIGSNGSTSSTGSTGSIGEQMRDGRFWALTILGVGSLLVWEFYSNSISYPMPMGAWWLHPYGTGSMALLLALAAITLGGDRLRGRSVFQKFLLIASVLGLVATFLLAGISWFSVSEPVALVSCVLAGMLRTLLMACWLVAVARLETLTCTGVIVASLVFSSLTEIIMPHMNGDLVCVLGSAMPAISCVCLWMFEDRVPEVLGNPVIHYRKDGSIQSLWTVGVCIAVVTCVCSVVSQTIKTQYGSFVFSDSPIASMSTISRLLEIIICLVVAWWVFVHKGSFAFPPMWRLVVLLAVIMLLSILVFGNSQAVKVFQIPTTMFTKVLAIIMMANVIRHSDCMPYGTAAMGILFFTLPSYLGRVIVMTPLGNILTPSLALGLMAALTLATAFCATSQSVSVRNLLSELNNAPVVQEDYNRIESRCAELSREFGLSEREAEVLVLLAKGRSKPYIAEELFISENTVRTYAKRIYGKLSIHSKADLQSLLGL